MGHGALSASLHDQSAVSSSASGSEADQLGSERLLASHLLQVLGVHFVADAAFVWQVCGSVLAVFWLEHGAAAVQSTCAELAFRRAGTSLRPGAVRLPQCMQSYLGLAPSQASTASQQSLLLSWCGQQALQFWTCLHGCECLRYVPGHPLTLPVQPLSRDLHTFCLRFAAHRAQRAAPLQCTI